MRRVDWADAEQAAMRRALALAQEPVERLGANPRVGCVVLAPDGTVVGEGRHLGAGTPHAEVVALAEAGDRALGGTAVVTLEPCAHTGRTGPCTEALLAAGVARVVFAQTDPNPVAAGGAERLRANGVEVEGGLLEEVAEELNAAWSATARRGRPFVVWKFATTLDGRSAAVDGTSRWVSSPAARADTHRLRATCDTMLIGTNTVAVDDPLLTVRDQGDVPQPLRAVMGLRDLPADRRIFNADAETVRLRTRDPQVALADLRELGRHRVFLEGGPTLAAAFVTAGLVDEVVVYVAPMLLGSGRHAVGDLGISTISDAHHLEVTDVTTLPAAPGEDLDVRITLRGLDFARPTNDPARPTKEP